MGQPLVLLTGAAGNIGRWVLSELLNSGYYVRALTTRSPDAMDSHGGRVEWRQMDFQRTLDFRPHVGGCVAVVHLAAEIVDADLMERVNVHATRSLARASEAAGVRVFIYTSSVSVYGSGLTEIIDEGSPVLSTGSDVRSEYWAEYNLRCYGRTKLQGECALRDELASVEAIVLRPAVVVDVPQLIDAVRMSRLKKMLIAYRRTQHVYVRDVADTVVWFIDRALRRDRPRHGVSVFNVADSALMDDSFAHFFAKMYAATGDANCNVRTLPRHLDWFREVLKFRTLPLRYSLGRMKFSTKKLSEEGFDFQHGVGRAYELAAAELAKAGAE